MFFLIYASSEKLDMLTRELGVPVQRVSSRMMTPASHVMSHSYDDDLIEHLRSAQEQNEEFVRQLRGTQAQNAELSRQLKVSQAQQNNLVAQLQASQAHNASLIGNCVYWRKRFFAQTEECIAQQADLIQLQSAFYVAQHSCEGEKCLRFLGEAYLAFQKETTALLERELAKELSVLQSKVQMLEDRMRAETLAIPETPKTQMIKPDSPNVGRYSPFSIPAT